LPFISLATKTTSIGQTVILVGLSGEKTPVVSMGIVTSLNQQSNASSSPEVVTNISDYAGNSFIGGPLVSLSGETVALNLGFKAMAPSQDIARLISATVAPAAQTGEAQKK
jgi:S1-C subfamily serine protease